MHVYMYVSESWHRGAEKKQEPSDSGIGVVAQGWQGTKTPILSVRSGDTVPRMVSSILR